jgi:hypothetical protein
MDYTTIFMQSWDFFKKYFKEALKFMLPFILLVTIGGDFIVMILPLTDSVNVTQTNWTMFFLAFMIKANLFALTATLFLHFIKDKVYQTQKSSQTLIQDFVAQALPFFIITNIAAPFIYLAAWFLIIPAFYVALRLSYSWFYLVFEELSPLQAVKKSLKETKGEVKDMAILLGMAVVPGLLILFVLFLVLTLVFDGAALSLSLSILIAMIFLFTQIILYRIYAEYGNDQTQPKKKVSL